jgi:hypothetical protein
MKKKTEKTGEKKPEPVLEPNDELKDFIRRKNIQNKVLKEMIDKIKKSK